MKRLLCLLAALTLFAAPALAQENHPDCYNWYEIFVSSYQDSNGDGTGDLQGVISRLDYITDMGYNALWLMPIMPSPSYHKYDVTDYMNVDPAYGTVEDMKALTSACHERGMRMIIDLPVNHTSTRHPWFEEACTALREGRTVDPFVSYYSFTQTPGSKTVPLEGTAWHYEEQFSGGHMPDLNLANPQVKEEIRHILAFWLQEVGVDGFRLDAVTSFFASDVAQNVAFLAELKGMAEAIKPGSYLVGEAWVGLSAIAEYYQSGVDSFFLFPASQAEGFIVKSLMGRSPNAKTYASGLEKALEAIPKGVLAPFLCNHDTGRSVGLLQARQIPERAKFAQGALNMLPGNVFTYYGDEIGMVGAGDDPNKRLAMYWNDGDMTLQPPGVTKIEYAYPSVDAQLADPDSLLNYCKAVNHARLLTPAIARGKNTFLQVENTLCVMKRETEDASCIIAMNFSPKAEAQITVDAGLRIVSDIEVAQSRAALDSQTLTLPPYAIVILR